MNKLIKRLGYFDYIIEDNEILNRSPYLSIGLSINDKRIFLWATYHKWSWYVPESILYK